MAGASISTHLYIDFVSHYITLHYTTLHYITLQYLHYLHTYIHTYTRARAMASDPPGTYARVGNGQWRPSDGPAPRKSPMRALPVVCTPSGRQDFKQLAQALEQGQRNECAAALETVCMCVRPPKRVQTFWGVRCF